MRFSCRSRDPLEWHRHFALLPVEVAPNECRWLETVERRFTWRGMSGVYHDPIYRAAQEKAR